MKKICLTSVEEISSEIDRLLDNQVGLFCLLENKKTKKLVVKGKTQAENGPLLVVNNPSDTDFSTKAHLFLYQLPGQPLRSFQCTPEKQVGTLLGLRYPTEIFEIQRRKFPRVPAVRNSTVTFCLRNKQKFHVGKVEDVSMEGAKISGNFPVVIAEGETLVPVSLRLLLQSVKDNETEVLIPEAQVVRVSSGNEDRTKEFAIHFVLPEKEMHPLSHYVDIRTVEESCRSRSMH